jgi:hypothetical protein
VTLFTIFRNRIDAIAAEAGQELDRMVLLLESSGGEGAGPSGGLPRPAAGAGAGV